MNNLRIVGSTKDYKIGDEMLVKRQLQYAKGRIMKLGATREDYLKQVAEDGLIPPHKAFSKEAKFYYVALD